VASAQASAWLSELESALELELAWLKVLLTALLEARRRGLESFELPVRAWPERG
jgi:hypothetical protein